jgi:hypothetical protein
MIEIKENQELNIDNLLSYRGKIKQEEIERIGIEMENYVQKADAKRVGNPITATYAVEGDNIDIELILPIDKRVESTDKFIFKNKIKIVNAIVAEYKGNPIGLQEACNQLNQYIIEHGLQPITVGYNVTKKIDMINPANAEIDVFVGISQNIL